MKILCFITLICLGVIASPYHASCAELTLSDVASLKGDGTDGDGNTADDTWRFWFELAHAPNTFAPLDRHSTIVPKNGIPRKVHGPIASELPNPDDTVGWIFHSDWDGKKEGVWADKKANAILVCPYVEKASHMGVAITYKIPDDGKYNLSGRITDVQVDTADPKTDGVIWKVQVANEGKLVRQLGAAKPAIGDGRDRPDSGEFKFDDVELKKGQLVRLVIHPNRWMPTDLTRVDAFKIEPVK
ncbi:MAG: hypothetical protein K8T91_26925 [Planctomycetes bacterium]|nr:hypothetical protein [Planctomycetota bacterium]